MLTSFKANVITKLGGLGNKDLINKNNKEDIITPRNISGEKWYHFGDKYRNVAYDLTFQNKMSICSVMYWCFLVGDNQEVCP